MGLTPFHSKEFVIPGTLGGQPHCFSAVLCPSSPLGKAFTYSILTNCSTVILNWHKLPALSQSLPADKFK